jgi:hypothetical protein
LSYSRVSFVYFAVLGRLPYYLLSARQALNFSNSSLAWP